MMARDDDNIQGTKHRCHAVAADFHFNPCSVYLNLNMQIAAIFDVLYEQQLIFEQIRCFFFFLQGLRALRGYTDPGISRDHTDTKRHDCV